MENIPLIDAMAVVAASGDLVITLIHRGAEVGPIELTINLEGFQAQQQADAVTLAGDTWYDRSTRETPEKAVPNTVRSPWDPAAVLADAGTLLCHAAHA